MMKEKQADGKQQYLC